MPTRTRAPAEPTKNCCLPKVFQPASRTITTKRAATGRRVQIVGDAPNRFGRVGLIHCSANRSFPQKVLCGHANSGGTNGKVIAGNVQSKSEAQNKPPLSQPDLNCFSFTKNGS